MTVETLTVSQPITIECVAEVSRRYQIPVALLGGVLAQERGRLGQSSPNKNGTRDLGPMQVNSSWLAFFESYGVTEHRLKHDGCANLAVGAWIIRYEQGRAKGDLWQAVGRYHSHKPDLATAYQSQVAAKVGKLNTGQWALDRLLEEANGGG